MKRKCIKENKVAKDGKPRHCFANRQTWLPWAWQLCKVLGIGFQTVDSLNSVHLTTCAACILEETITTV